MTLSQLRYAVAVDTHRHFGRAAVQCCVSQPTLSAQIQKLEAELGIRLFDRSQQPIVPTDLGRQVLAQARVVLREGARIPDLVVEAAGAVQGELRIGVLPTLGPYLLPLLARPFAARYPEAILSVREWTTERILDGLATDRLDAGLVATDEARPGMVEQPLFQEPFVAYLSAEHRLASRAVLQPADLAGEDLWLLAEGHCFREQALEVCGQGGGHGPLRFESGTLETLRMLVDRSGGGTLLPLLAVHAIGPAARRHLRPFAPPAPQREVRLIYGRAYLKRSLIEAFSQTIQDVVGPELAALSQAVGGAGGEP